jgi:predicted nucleotidyltransferase
MPLGRHLPQREVLLRREAELLCQLLSEDPHVVGIFLAGSVARGGPVTAASDLDMYVFRHGELPGGVSQEWAFCPDETLRDVHSYDTSVILAGLGSDDARLVEWFYSTQLGDLLDGSEVLYWRPEASVDLGEFQRMLKRRTSSEIRSALVTRYADACQQSLRIVGTNAPGACRSAHQLLRWVSQDLLIGAMVRRGWTIRAAKKRPEMAEEFAHCDIVRAARGTLLSIVGVDHLSQSRARELSQLRLRLRTELLLELRRLAWRSASPIVRGRFSDEVRRQEEHNAGAFDYYSSLVSDGQHRGAVNHIRALSGFSRLPGRIMNCMQPGTPQACIEDFLSCEELTLGFREHWSEIADLSGDSSRIGEWLLTCERLVQALRAPQSGVPAN